MKILKILETEKVTTVKEIARQLGQDPSLIRVQIELLEKKGYLKCESKKVKACHACPLKHECGPSIIS